MNTITATLRNIMLPDTLQQNYPNYKYWVTPDNTLKRVPERLKETDQHGNRIIRKDENNKTIYELSDKIQTIWETEDGTLFIITFKTKETIKETEILPGSYGTSYTQETIKVKDYMRWFLINPIISQNGLFNKDDSNVQVLKKLIKYKIPVNFNKVTTLSENGNIYTNYQAITEQ